MDVWTVLAALVATETAPVSARQVGDAPPASVRSAPFSPFLRSGARVFAPTPDLYVAPGGTPIAFSRDGKTLLATIPNDRTGRFEHRRRVEMGGEPFDDSLTLARISVATGRRDILHRTGPGEILAEITLVGVGGDTLFVVRSYGPETAAARVYFAPENGVVRPVTPPLDAKSPPTLIASPELPRALIASRSDRGALSVLLIGADTAKTVALPAGSWQNGSFSFNTRTGGARLAISGVDSTGESVGKVLEIDYATGSATEPGGDDIAAVPFPDPRPLFRAELSPIGRLKPDAMAREPSDGVDSPARHDLDLVEDGPAPRRHTLVRGIVGRAFLVSHDGLKVAFRSASGFFVAEMIALTPDESRKRLKLSAPR